MAIEWYLMRPPYNQLSGFEEETVEDYYADGFEEVLDTSIASDVELYNYDLSVVSPLRVVIENKVQDTRLQSLVRTMLSPIGTCKAGMYVKYKGRFWLISNCVDDNGFYEKSVLSLCNYLLTWVNSKGKIVQRWANITSASQYNNGETNMKYYFVRSDQLMVLFSNDDESLLLNSGERFVIDERCSVYEKSIDEEVTQKTDLPLTTYQLTRSDTVLYDYGDSGIMGLIVTQDEKHDGDGYYKIGDKGYWLCERPVEDGNKNRILSCAIISEYNDIYNNVEAGVFRAEFYDKEGNVVRGVTPKWEIECDFIDKLDVTMEGDHISIAVNDARLINKSFKLILSADGYGSASTTITIKAFL